MSKLRQTILEQLRILGNHSGCHQNPERSFFYKGKQFPICARCTGVFIGQICAVLFGLIGFTISFYRALFLLLIMGSDWSFQTAKIKESTNRRRLITGVCGGFGLFSIYIIISKKIILKIIQPLFKL